MFLTRRFPTNRRLWIFLTLTLFLLMWLIPVDWKGSRDEPIGVAWIILFSLLLNCDYYGGEFSYMISSILQYGCIFALVSLVLGWIIQCVLTIMRFQWQRVTRSTNSVANSQNNKTDEH